MEELKDRIKTRLESIYSMPFEITSSVVDGETHYVCWPSNEGQQYIEIRMFIHSGIRLKMEIVPQLHGRSVLDDMAIANTDKKKKFKEYLELITDEDARVSILVNNAKLSTENWPVIWRSFSCKITKSPLPELLGDTEFLILSKWFQHGFSLIFSLLTIKDIGVSEEALAGYAKEGTPYEVQSIRYERNPINRELCLAHKGYTCSVCGFNFLETYGEIGKDYIEVHHTTMVSEMGKDYHFDVDKDLVPVCSNCHSMLHRRRPPYTVKELQRILEIQHKRLSVYQLRKVMSVNDDEEIKTFIESEINLEPNVHVLTLQSKIIGMFQEKYPDMKRGDWYFIITKYLNDRENKKNESNTELSIRNNNDIVKAAEQSHVDECDGIA